MSTSDGRQPGQPFDQARLISDVNRAVKDGRFDDAQSYLQAALALAPNLSFLTKALVQVHLHASEFAKKQGRLPDAIGHLERALSLAPRDRLLTKTLASAHAAAGDNAAALALQRGVLAANPNDVAALRNILVTSPSPEERTQAFDSLLHLARHNPKSAPDWRALSRHTWRKADWQETVDVLDEGISRTDSPALRLVRAMTFPKVAIDRAQIDRARQQASENLNVLALGGYRIPNIIEEVGVTAFHTAYHHYNNRDIQKQFAETHLALKPDLDWTDSNSPRFRSTTAPARRSPVRKRPRVGYLSAFHGGHVVGRSIQALIENSGNETVEHLIIRPENTGDGDDPGKTAPVITVDYHLERARSSVAELDLDILVYPEIGMDPLCYCLSFARLAPVQAVMPGQGQTTGVPNVDFFLTSAHWEPGTNIEGHYTEKPVRLPVPPYFFRPEAETPAANIRAELAIDPNANIYLCNHTIYKYHPDFDEILYGVLSADANATVVLLHSPNENWWPLLIKRWGIRLGSMISRVLMVPRLSRAHYLGLVQTANVILDSLPHGSGTTAYEALHLGTPIVTLRPTFMRGGMAAGLNAIMGIPDLVASDISDYVARAVAIATDRNKRSSLTQRLLAERQRLVCAPENAHIFIESLLEIAFS